MDSQPPSVPPAPYGNYNPPPEKKNRTWLYILLGAVGLCVICVIVGVIGYSVLTPQISEVFQSVEETVAVQVQPTLVAGNAQDFVGGNPIINGVTLAKDVSGEMLDPVNPTMVFSPTDTFHAVTSIQDAPDGTRFRADWYAVDVGDSAAPNTFIDGNELVAGETRNLDFSLSPNTNWPSGTYRVEIYVNDTLDRVIHFNVQ